MPLANPVCGALDALRVGQYLALQAVNDKIGSLYRLAALLEQAGDFNSFLPDINKLLPIAELDLQTFEALAANCPFLGLPAGLPGLDQARAALADSYAQLRSFLDNHPWNRMGNIQRRLDSVLSKAGISDIPLIGSDFLQCFQFVACGGLTAVASEDAAQARDVFERQVEVFNMPVSNVQRGNIYKVSGPGTVTYNGASYSDGQEFTAGAPVDFTTNGEVNVSQKPTVLTDVQRNKVNDMMAVKDWIDTYGTTF